MNDLRLLTPEIIVAITGAVVLVLDLVWPVPPERRNLPRPSSAYVAIVGLLLAGAASIALAGARGTLFSGIIVHDALATYFKLLFVAIGIVVLLISIDPLPRFSKWPAEFAALVVWCTLGHMLLSSAAELFTIFLCLQVTSLPLIVLIGYAKRDPASGEAALKYLLLVLVSTAVLLYGMTLIYGSLGTSTISEIALRLDTVKHLQPVVALGLVLLLTGFAFKITAVPFHWWVPDVYQGAPTPVTAFLSVGSKFAGFALAMRIIFALSGLALDMHLVLGIMAALSMTFGNLAAIRQTNIKRMLAYSGIAQGGYLLVGLASVSAPGVGAVLFYATGYAAANLLAFAVVIAFAGATGSERIEDYAGLSRRAPLPALAMTIALLSLGGLPLLAGFMGKFYVFLVAAQAGLIWLVAIGVVNSVIALYYYLRVVWRIYVAPSPEGLTPGEGIGVSRRMALAMALCTAGVIALGLLPDPILQVIQRTTSAFLGA